jgi:hypothetical protein
MNIQLRWLRIRYAAPDSDARQMILISSQRPFAFCRVGYDKFFLGEFGFFKILNHFIGPQGIYRCRNPQKWPDMYGK